MCYCAPSGDHNPVTVDAAAPPPLPQGHHALARTRLQRQEQQQADSERQWQRIRLRERSLQGAGPSCRSGSVLTAAEGFDSHPGNAALYQSAWDLTQEPAEAHERPPVSGLLPRWSAHAPRPRRPGDGGLHGISSRGCEGSGDPSREASGFVTGHFPAVCVGPSPRRERTDACLPSRRRGRRRRRASGPCLGGIQDRARDRGGVVASRHTAAYMCQLAFLCGLLHARRSSRSESGCWSSSCTSSFPPQQHRITTAETAAYTVVLCGVVQTWHGILGAGLTAAIPAK